MFGARPVVNIYTNLHHLHHLHHQLFLLYLPHRCQYILCHPFSYSLRSHHAVRRIPRSSRRLGKVEFDQLFSGDRSGRQ